MVTSITYLPRVHTGQSNKFSDARCAYFGVDPCGSAKLTFGLHGRERKRNKYYPFSAGGGRAIQGLSLRIPHSHVDVRQALSRENLITKLWPGQPSHKPEYCLGIRIASIMQSIPASGQAIVATRCKFPVWKSA